MASVADAFKDDLEEIRKVSVSHLRIRPWVPELSCLLPHRSLTSRTLALLCSSTPWLQEETSSRPLESALTLLRQRWKLYLSTIHDYRYITGRS